MSTGRCDDAGVMDAYQYFMRGEDGRRGLFLEYMENRLFVVVRMHASGGVR